MDSETQKKLVPAAIGFVVGVVGFFGIRKLFGRGGAAALNANHVKELKTALHTFFWNGDESVLPRCFQLFDLNGDGSLTFQEMQTCMNATFNEYVDEAEINAMIVEADSDKNGTIEIREFIAVMKKHRNSRCHGWGKLNLFESIGGDAAVKKFIDVAYRNIGSAQELAPFLVGAPVKKIIEAQYHFFAAGIGGPSPWSGRTLKEAHTGLNITEAAYQVHMKCFTDAAKECGMSQLIEAIEANYDVYRAQVVGI
jgi:hemoglobin